LVFYLPDQDEWEASCARMLAAGFQRVPSYNPYWEAQGQTPGRCPPTAAILSLGPAFRDLG
jgi:hypothetical protein